VKRQTKHKLALMALVNEDESLKIKVDSSAEDANDENIRRPGRKQK